MHVYLFVYIGARVYACIVCVCTCMYVHLCACMCTHSSHVSQFEMSHLQLFLSGNGHDHFLFLLSPSANKQNVARCFPASHLPKEGDSVLQTGALPSLLGCDCPAGCQSSL